jgi:Zn-dependent protease
LSIEALLWLLAILILSLSFHEAAHAWTANRLGDPTAKLLGRLTFNPMAHIDVIGTLVSRCPSPTSFVLARRSPTRSNARTPLALCTVT